MRVLHVMTVPWSVTEGVARSCLELATEMRDVESHLVTDRPPRRAAGAFASATVVRGWWPLVPWRARFRRVVAEVRPDVVHVHGGSLAPLLAYAPSLRGLPVVVSCYRSAARPRERAFGPGSLGERRANASPLRLLLGDTGGHLLVRRAMRSGRVAVVCTPDSHIEAQLGDAGVVLRTSGAARLSTHRACWSDDPVIVFAGRAQAARGVDDLVAAFRIVRAELPRARLRLLLLPGAAAAGWRSSLANDPAIEVVEGAQPDLEAELARCQVAVVPFRWSLTLTPPLVGAEAMATGLPVVGTTVDCVAPLVEPGANGALAPPADPPALAGALLDVLGDPETWQQLSDGARKTIEGPWSWAGAAEVVKDAYSIAQGSAR